MSAEGREGLVPTYLLLLILPPASVSAHHRLQFLQGTPACSRSGSFVGCLGHLYASVVCPWAAGITCSTAVFSALLKYIFTEVPLAWLVVGSDLSCGGVVVERTGNGWNHWNVLILALQLSPQRLSCRSSCQTSPRTPNRKIINFCCFLLTASRFLGAAYSFFKGFKYTKLLSLIQILFVEPGKKFYCCCTEIRNNHS